MKMKSLLSAGLLGLLAASVVAAPSFATAPTATQLFTVTSPVVASVDFNGSDTAYNLTSADLTAGTVTGALHLVVNTKKNTASNGTLTLSSSTTVTGDNTFQLVNGSDHITATPQVGATATGISTGILAAPFATSGYAVTADTGLYDALVDLDLTDIGAAGAYIATLTATFNAP